MGAYNFFPQFRINGAIERYNGEFAYIHNSFAVRGEYDQVAMYRTNIGSYQVGNLGFLSLPGIRAKRLGSERQLPADGREAAGKRHSAGEAPALRA